MIKIIDPSGWDFDRPISVLVKLSSRGLVGNDRTDFIKFASHAFLPYIDNIKVAKDEVPVHTIALGATEWYGANRNGDGFKEATCRANHQTFEKYAKWFRNHKNKLDKKDPYYGYVKKSAYNEDMHRIELLNILNATKEAAERNGGFVADKEIEKLASGDDLATSMACALAGTLVKVRDGFKKIENIEVGDSVLTHRGRYRRVSAVMQRTKQQYVRVKLKYSGRRTLEFTPDHLFYVARWSELPRGKGANNVRSKEPTGVSKPTRTRRRNELAAYARWIPCGDLRPDDLLLMPKSCGQSWSELTKEQARILGYYTAEGSITSDGYPCFTCHKDDIAVGELPTLVTASTSTIEHSQSEFAVNLSVYDKKLGLELSGICGRGVRVKRIPRVVHAAAADVKLEFLSAWFNGDGWQDVKGLHWSTCSQSLSIELQMILASIDIPASVYRIDHTSDLPNGCKRQGDGIEYTVNVSNRYSGLFYGSSKAEFIETKEHTTAFITGDYLALPVESIKHIEKPVKVYDITVAGDESFTAFGMSVHNCRVPYDICSSCGNRARTREEYCTAKTCKYGGCRDNLTKVASDGHILHVDNPNPIWFDESSVFRPADRIAYGANADWLDKAASHKFTPGAEMAEMLGITAPLNVVLSQDESIHWNQSVMGQLKLARALATVESDLSLLPEDTYRAFTSIVQPAISDTALSMLGTPGTEKSAAALAELADRKIIIPLRDFARWHGKEASVSGAAQLLPSVYRQLMSCNNLEFRVVNNAYAVSHSKTASTAMQKLAQDLAPVMSLSVEAVRHRAMLSSLREPNFKVAMNLKTSFWNEKAASNTPDAVALAEEYAVYKLAALYRIAENDGDFNLTARLAVGQNRVC